MIVHQQVLQLSEYGSLYDLIVPKENLLTKINDLIDFNFIYEELQTKYSQAQGCVSECPIKLFKYLLLKVICTISAIDVLRERLKQLRKSIYRYQEDWKDKMPTKMIVMI